MALLSKEGFERAILSMIEEARAAGRGDDLAKIARHLDARRTSGEAQGPVNQLAALMFLIDEEYRLPLQKTIDAFRRWRDRKDDPVGDEEVFTLLEGFYQRALKGS